MITTYSQIDPRWSHDRIGNSNVTLGQDGCVVCCDCMASSYFQGLKTGNMVGSITPPQLAAQKGSFDRTGRIEENLAQLPYSRITKHLYGYNPVSIAASVKGPDTAVRLNVLNGRHWVLAVAQDGTDWEAIDPIGGVHIKAIEKYGPIVGSAHYSLK